MSEPDAPAVITKLVPDGGVPPVIDSQAALDEATERLVDGIGPIGIDTERASGYRYSQRAYLVQLYREGSGTFVIDPLPFESLSRVADALSGIEHIFHAASQDLPSLREAGYAPTRLFDTELSARLLGLERVGLGAVVESLLGIHLAKAHSADDWSTRPLPASWISYAALDVQLLPNLRDVMDEMLRASGKRDFAEQEFLHELNAPPKPEPLEPWRRLSGLHSLRQPRQRAIARALWLARDGYAREIDLAPGKIIPDAAIVAAAQAQPTRKEELAALAAFTGRQSRSKLDYWWSAIEEGRISPPPAARGADSEPPYPPVKAWKAKNPLAAARLHDGREAVRELAGGIEMPVENLLSPGIVRHAAWLGVTDQGALADFLRQEGARSWQIEATAAALASAFLAARVTQE